MSAKPAILLIEDNSADVKLALHALRNAGVSTEIVVVRDGEEALEFVFATGKYADRDTDLSLKMILLDLKIPKVNGFEVLRALKSSENTKAIPVIVLTSSNQDHDLRESYRLGANSYVQKPVDFDRFQELITLIEQYWLRVNLLPPAAKAGDAATGGVLEKSK